MDKNQILTLIDIAKEFGEIAEQVSTSAVLRKNHTDEAIKIINVMLELEDQLKKEIALVSRSNIEQRTRDTYINNTSIILLSNVQKQQEIIETLSSKQLVDSDVINEYNSMAQNLVSALKEAQSNISKMIQADNEIILMDTQLMMSKNKQNEFIKKLKNRTLKSFEEAENAIDGSASNLKRGKDLAEDYGNIEELISDKNRDELNRLIVEANTGWHLAIEVNKNSNSQLEYAEMVYEYTKELHNDSLLIKELIQKKHTVFEHNLQIVTIVTVLISVKFKNFLESVNTIQQFKTTDENRSLLNDLQVLHDITCKEIRGLLSLNLDMTNASHLNNETETKSIELTNKEIELFESLKKEVEYITEATRFSINGSYKNISNGQLLEKSLKEIVSNI